MQELDVLDGVRWGPPHGYEVGDGGPPRSDQLLAAYAPTDVAAAKVQSEFWARLVRDIPSKMECVYVLMDPTGVSTECMHTAGGTACFLDAKV